ncbi:Fanconi anemia group D2 protein [Notothenia coriiceps]|uniref:Fanconi anemia group D2 protein n=1 Tax=Notothenia coriiceps TaxID=8208 RepID=A0A6I9P2I5_9TELE|nr:PREDICTED: Fanconi anemia group D2 protein [Notothenia coriiceps]
MLRKKRRSTADKVEAATTSTKAKKSRSTGRQPKEPAPEETNESVFGVFLREAGVTLKQGGTSNEIAVDQVVFQKRIKKQLQKSPRYPGIVQEFTAGLESHIEEPERFRNCLLPCVPRLSDGDSSCVSSFQESLLRMLLGIEILQTPIINTLIEKIPEFMLDGAGDGGLSIPHIIINQLKWLDRVVDSKELAVKLMELVSVAPVEVQRDIITSLPEILDDTQHNDIARELNSLLQENTQLTVPILDALSSLNLSTSLLTEVRGAVMATLAAVQLEDLPLVVKFILHSVSASDVYEVVCSLRKKLELEQCVLPPVLQASQSRMKSKGSAASSSTAAGRRSSSSSSSSSQDSVALVLDGIKSAVRFQKRISEAWLKAIESVDEAEDHKVIDVLVLFILHSTNANQSRRGAERLVKLKVRGGLIQEALLQRTFRDYAQVMRGYFPSILALAQGLLRSHDPCVVPFGGHMYRHSFAAFDSYCQQEVVGSLVTHVCSGVGGEVDMALELLCGLVTEKPSEMSLYAVFVKGILDYMDNLTPQQIRRLFHLLSTLAFGQQQQGSLIQDDMHIVIRKQLSSTVPKYKRIGIIGAVMIIGSMGAARPKVKESQNGLLPQETLRQVAALLELVKSSSESSAEAAALYYDELANLILSSILDPQVQEKIGKTVLDDFQDDFVVDLGPDILGSFPLTPHVIYNLDDEESQGGIAINLLPLLATELQNKGEQKSQTQKAHKRVSPLCLSPFFRLLRLCEEKQHQGDLEEIDALLGEEVEATHFWSGFSQPGQRSLLKKALGVLAERLKEESAELTLEQLVKHSFKYLMNFCSTMPNLSTALTLSQLLSTVSERGGDPAAHREQTASLAKRFLGQSWVTASGEKERGIKFNEALHTVLKMYMAHVDDVLKAVEEIAGEGIPELIKAAKDESSASWPTLNRQTFLVYYKVMMTELEKAIRKIPACKVSDSSEAQSEKLLIWNLAVRDFHILVNLGKVFDSRPVLIVCLKYGRLFLESFLRLGMPLLDNSFKRHMEDVQSLLKTFQLSTRQLHHMCGYSKMNQDTSLTNHVPALKKSLELFVYRVKAMLTLNNCQEAFWIGNLKNRNLKGEEILSQRSHGSEDEDEEEQSPPQEQSEDEAQEMDSEESTKVHRTEDVDQDDITDDSD